MAYIGGGAIGLWPPPFGPTIKCAPAPAVACSPEETMQVNVEFCLNIP